MERRESPLIVKKDRKKLFKAGAIFLIWIIAVFYIGSNVSKTSTEMAKENPKMSEVQNPTGYGVPDDQKTPEQKANTEKLSIMMEDFLIHRLALIKTVGSKRQHRSAMVCQHSSYISLTGKILALGANRS